MSELQYRQQALDNISSPEQLGKMIQVVGSQAWLLLTAIVFCIAVALFWSIFGEIPTRVQGSGMLFSRNAATRAVTTPVGGQVTDVLVTPGQNVRRGDVLVRLDQPDMRQNLSDAERTLASLRSQRDKVAAFWQAFLQHEHDSLLRQRQNLQAVLESQDHTLRAQIDLLGGYRWLFANGYASRINVEGAQEKVFSTEASRNNTTLSVTQLAARELQDENERDTALRDYDLQIIQAEEKRDEVKLTLQRGSVVLSPQDGRIATLSAQPSTMLASGGAVATLDFRDRELEALVFVPANDGKRVHVGMKVNVAPSTVHAEKDGTLIGHVGAVSEIPESRESMMRLLNNEAMVEQFLHGGPPLLVSVRLEPTNTPTGYRWTSGKGPNISLTPGTPLEGDVQVMEQRPIVLVLPLLRRWFGLYT